MGASGAVLGAFFTILGDGSESETHCEMLLAFISFYSYKSKVNTCEACGAISLGLSKTCMNCGANLENISNNNQFNKKPSESIIEVKAEEVK